MSRTESNNVTFSTSDSAEPPVVVTNASGVEVEHVDNDGFNQVRYRDEYAGSVYFPASGAAAPDEVNVTIGGVATRSYAFDGVTTEERLANHFEIPHDLALNLVNAGTVKIEWHVHFRPSGNTAGDVKWFFDYCYTPPNAAPISQTALTCIRTIELNQQHFHLLSGAELPIPVGGFEIGGVITFNIRRSPSDAGDTYTADALFIKTALHVPVDGRGSRQRYIK